MLLLCLPHQLLVARALEKAVLSVLHEEHERVKVLVEVECERYCQILRVCVF